MKKILLLFTVAAAMLSACSKFDDSRIWNELNSLNGRVEKLETLCNQMNTNILSLQAIVSALQQNETISNVYTLPNGEGYTITFSTGKTITIYNGTNGKDGVNGADGKDGKDGIDGKDGVNGKDGSTPVVGVKKDTDGIYYWTLNGEWLTDEAGNKIKAVGTDGANGNDGADGKDGITPQLKIEDGYWYVSTDNGSTWTQLGKATGENGKDGADGTNGKDGKDGDSIFTAVVENEYNVVFTLADGSTITIAKSRQDSIGITFYSYAFKQYCVENFDTDGDGGISEDEAKDVTEINISKIGVTSLAGIEHFTNLEKLDVSHNPIYYLDLSKNIALTALDVSNTSLTTLGVSNTSLTTLGVSNTSLTTLDVSNTSLMSLTLNDGVTVTGPLNIGCLVVIGGVRGLVYSSTDSKTMLVSMSETSATWGPTSTTTGATDSNNGMNNMNIIVEKGISSYPAFKWCRDLGTQWYLPSKTELETVYYNKANLTSAGTEFKSSWYWSSTEYDNDSDCAYLVDFNNGDKSYIAYKSFTTYVRAVRAL